ncbi:glycosyl hydrolase family 28-related protein [Burkholderia multivorans]|uniref:glycosyl hydrolase family 28-related protein n=1 Tax=Burkholderia multivorans TaxID=87883 RepID=UPI001C247B20|nr:glycosyl hydrolase family 28-related protein [Burkholderia multivorans]MBU9228196.1 glycoside hydrolase family 55 protein [Burkholderia multivorans]MBU9310853.1 glycoside hydrolase family 55 protein [Burkholderia multivorans]
MKKFLIAVLFAPLVALAQTYPSPTFNSVTLINPLTIANGGTGATTSTGGVNNLQYLTGATGGVARTLQSKFGDIVSIADFGADPTGSADSTSAIQSAITYALSLTNGGQVYIPQGTYKVTAQINIPNTTGVSIRIFGAGAASKIKYSGSATITMFYAGSGAPTFGSLYQFDNFGVASPTGGTITVFGLQNINNSLFYNVSVFGNATALSLNNSFNTRVIGCYFNTQTQYGITTATTGTNALYVMQTGISNAGAAAINLGVGGNNIVIRDSDLEANATAIAAANYTSVLIAGNYIENGTGAVFSLTGTNSQWSFVGNWLGANSVTTTINNLSGGMFTQNTLFNSAWAWGAAAFDIDSGENTLQGTATLGAVPFHAVSSFTNNWTGSNVGYRLRSNGVVELRGDMIVGTSSLGNAAFTLPVGYRPAQSLAIPSANTSGNTLCVVYINASTGTVSPSCAGGAVGNLVALDGVSFMAN